MKSIFVSNEDVMEIRFFIGLNDKGEVVIDDDKEKVDKKAQENTVEKHFVRFRKPTYKDNVDIMSQTLSASEKSIRVDPALLRYERLCTLITDWSLTDASGEKLRPTRANIDKLQPVVANLIMDLFDDALED